MITLIFVFLFLVRLWSMETKTNLVCYKGHNYPIWDVDFSPLGYYFASASHDRTARIWSTDHIFPLRVLAGHLSDVDVKSNTNVYFSSKKLTFFYHSVLNSTQIVIMLPLVLLINQCVYGMFKKENVSGYLLDILELFIL